MGRLRYDGTSEPILIEDETLAHLKVIIGTKLRRQESFMMTWSPGGEGPARLSAWIHPSIPLVIAFDDAAHAPIDAARVTKMMEHLNAHGEIVVSS